ncbi:MAG: nitrous oxide-stimulated promoter family protein [Bacteroidota bacterium]
MNEGEKVMIEKMISIYCRKKHNTTDALCTDCARLLAYASRRLDKCHFGEDKPVCKVCPIHCYEPEMRRRIREVMRFAGPRMMLVYPLYTIKHFYKEHKRKKTKR